MRSNYAHSGHEESSFAPKPKVELKSGDFVSYRSTDGSEAVFPRYRDSGYAQRLETQRAVQPVTAHHAVHTSVPQEFEQQGNWRVVSKDDSHITWTRIGSELERNPPTVRPSFSTRQIHSHNELPRHHIVGSGPHYPMMLEKETRDRANRLGNVNHIAY